jgi:pilus assembly protein Flp/PilA
MARSDARPKDDEGASAVEYGLIVVAIAAVIAAVVFILGGYVRGSFQGACDNLDTVGAPNANAAADCDS